MSSSALELLARTVAEQVAERRCARCERLLAGSRVTVRPLSEEQVAVSIECRGCGERLVLRVEPEAGDGVAELG